MHRAEPLARADEHQHGGLAQDAAGQEPPVFLLTVDVEDWFQVENFKPWIPFDSWGSRELRVVDNTLRLMDSLEALGGSQPVKITFFVLGWVAARCPELIREMDARGHEVASHGYNHQLVPTCADDELTEDLVASRQCLEDILGKPVAGYRAPSFSIEPRLIRILAECGYRYDASYNSYGGNARYGSFDDMPPPDRGVARLANGLYELPVSNLSVAGRTVPWGGGGFFRLIPKGLYIRGVKAEAARDGVFHFYLHPWEIDPHQPRVRQASPMFKFRHYLNLGHCLAKLTYLLKRLDGFVFSTCSEHLGKVTNDSIEG
ncbi:DUF3473 domain-containing protein [Desulfoluna butyratoxydans]|uniref:Glycoside hydrolase/deacetylase beta/alpha-barrel n=1 Tax=Desulfoluna butyratoxydans TaxID=231438 RepID=A0A4U8YT04_9BACT|nr:DUF3473 domain-containing protein [Desulfoluna butyratoxydans]VFQ44433.1 glycoside hydrolase/deacetylase beta/alpha-barrel [Desulfoluna butyratoxydans]